MISNAFGPDNRITPIAEVYGAVARATMVSEFMELILTSRCLITKVWQIYTQCVRYQLKNASFV